MSETKTIKCPFCGIGDIVASYAPKALVMKYSKVGSNKKLIKYFKDEKYSVISSECPACHKSKTEIQKFFREGKSISMAEAARKAKELGLPMKI